MIDPILLANILKAGAPLALAIIQLLRDRGHEADAVQLEQALARADANFDLVIARAESAPLPEPGSLDEGSS